LRADAAARGVELETVPEPRPLDTAGGVRSALDRVDGAFLVLNGDILTDVDVTAAVAAHERADADATVVLTRVDDTSSFGVCVLERWDDGDAEGQRITDFVEKPDPDEAPSTLATMGRYVFEPAIFDYLEKTEPGHGGEIQLTDAMAAMARDNGMRARTFEGTRLDVGTVEGFLEANVAMARHRGTYPE
jgi:NDP-sugar pyrophosphorylase family protein